MKIPNKSLEFLRNCLAEPGWNKGDDAAKKHKRFYLSGKLLAELPEVPDAPLPMAVQEAQNNPQKAKDWVKNLEVFNSTPSAEFTVDDKSLEVIQFCLKHFIEEDRIPKGKFGNALVDAFKLFEV